MKKNIHTLILLLVTVTVSLGQGFVTTWKTDNPGTSASNQITIPTLGTGYNYNVTWGDGSSDSNVTGNITHTYTLAGTYTVTITGDFPKIYFNNTGDKGKILTVEAWGNIVWTSMQSAFYGCSNIDITATDAPNLSGVTTLGYMFNGCAKLNANINHWDVSTITSMAQLFNNAKMFNQNISGWNVSNVLDMSFMFNNASAFNQDISGWDVSKVVNMASMFNGASVFNQAIGSWNVGNVTNMSGMFGSAIAFNQSISSWNVAKVNNMNSMFYRSQQFNQQIGSWNVASVTDMSSMFNQASAFNQDIGNWDVSKVTNMSNMFAYTAFNQPIGIWNVANVLNMSNMFINNVVFNQPLGSWNVGKVTNMTAMFKNCTVYNGNIGNWDVSQVTIMTDIFNGAAAFNQNIGNWNVSNVTTMLKMFNAATAFNQNIGSWDVSKVSNMNNMFNAATSFNQNLGNWNISLVTNMLGIFNSTIMSAVNYDNTLIGWAALPTVANNITVGASGLKYCEAVNARNTLITNFNWVFSGDIKECPTFNTTWSTGAVGESVVIPTVGIGYDYYVDWGDGTVDYNVTGNASHNYATPGTHIVKIYGSFPRIYFNGGGHLNKIRSIEQWGGIKWESMENAFSGCFNLVNNATDVPDLSMVTSLAGMFRNAGSFDADLSGWDVSTITDMSNMLDNTRMTYFNYDRTINGWAAKPILQSNVTVGAAGVPYCEAGRSTLMNSKNWSFVGDKKGCPFITTWETNPSKMVTIPVTGSGYKYYVEWGDGTYTFHNNSINAQHTYSTAGIYTIRISGDFPRFNGVAYANPYIKTIEGWGDIAWTSMLRAFRGCVNLTSNAQDAPNLSNVTILSEMFLGATSYNGDLSNWDVSNVTTMTSMFNQATSFNGNVSTWNVSKVTNMASMFANASVFNSDISGWNVSNVTAMRHMLYQASPFNQDISGWNVSKVTDMGYMLSGLENFNQPIGKWDVSAVTSMSGLLSGSPLFNQPLDTWNVSLVTDMSDMFNGAHAFNQSIGNWDVSSVTSFGSMFYEALSFNQPIGSWNVSSSFDLIAMFYGATDFNQDIGSWDLSNGPDIYEMFYGATSFNQDISGWDISMVSDLISMFFGATSFDQNLSTWNVGNVLYMDNMFDNSGMSRGNYDKTLLGWAALPSLQPDVVLGASGLLFCEGSPARDQLSVNYNWTFVSDVLDCVNTITFDAIIDQIFEAGSLLLNATASSGLDIFYEVISGPASVNGSTLTFTGLGTVVVRASQAGNSLYSAATSVDQTFNIITITGVDEDLSAVEIYPNPTSDYLIVVLPNSEKNQGSLISLNGKVHIQVDIQRPIDMRGLERGIYLLRITTPENSIIRKIVKN